MFATYPGDPRRPDPLCPASGLLPVSEFGGGYRPNANVPGALRPYSASLAVRPIECGKHDTTGTRWTETKATKQIIDGTAFPDSEQKVFTDT